MFTRCDEAVSRCSLACLFVVASCGLFLGSSGRADDGTKVSGSELFQREWIPNDARSRGGDGLGPQFNESSCVACHNQGGPGGAGPAAKNVQLVSVFRFPDSRPTNRKSNSFSVRDKSGKSKERQQSTERGSGQSSSTLDDLFGESQHDSVEDHSASAASQTDVRNLSAEMQKEREKLASIHPGFRNANSIVLHRMSTAPGYGAFRRKFTRDLGMPGMLSGNISGIPGFSSDPFEKTPEPDALLEERFQVERSQAISRTPALQIEGYAFLVSERNTTALFGSGQIDAIPDEILTAAAQKKFDDYPDVSGRVAKLKNGRLGRFGWKGQKTTLRDFILSACAVELGLNVPGEAQTGIPHNSRYEAPGMDLLDQEFNAMVEFVSNLANPQVRIVAHQSDRNYIKGGRERFDSVGCGACHIPHLGSVRNIYSDLLLHDMGLELSDSGSYGGLAPNSTEGDEANQRVPELVFTEPKSNATDESKSIGATRREWRTPPLWGARDSAPYLHDGRAATLEQAIAMHGGEGAKSARKFFELSEPERLQVTLFLRALVAPQQ